MGSDLLKAQLDLGWVKKAGENPIEVLKSYQGRVELIHIKDVDKAGEFTEVGKGIVGYRGILDKAAKVRVKYYIVEQDYSPHPLWSAKMSLDFLKAYGA
jgi:sugar phosphate isomerase/epimerase